MSVTILIVYVAGTADMLDVCLASLKRHPGGIPYKVRIITKASKISCQISDKNDLMAFAKYGASDDYAEAMNVASCYENIEVWSYEIGYTLTGSEMHGKLLDKAVYDVDTEYVLTMDSDCFPVADNWLQYFMELHRLGAEITGILWPWIPPPANLNKNTIEYRVRKNHCWNNTQVVCQLVKKSFVIQNGLLFNSGDDTGFSLCEFAHSKDLLVTGLKPTRCALPKGNLDPEMNRHVCVVYGDMIYHQGGSTRKKQGASVDPLGYYDEARERVFREKGAEWILKDENSYRYRFDKEEDVAQFKMNAMFAEMKKYLETHDTLFDQ